MKRRMTLSLISIALSLGATQTIAENSLENLAPQKAVVIVFTPPTGMEKEFLESFTKEQAANFSAHGSRDKKTTESINLIPTKLGEPLIHITILKDKATYEKTYQAFGPKENRGAYVGKHSEKYGDLNIPKVYLQNSQSYFADIVR
ncbi:hypothetical protein [Pseudomonas palleroniana]|uniref:Uncharacterized protein n=2 Tax=Pseudomonas palleroniana TaxID=191390 RepID=A0A1H5B3P9_9PSED|nr:hypothetical protein [Pseudomonas palleroniana]KAB0567611.1 hypothetical protein F7R03_11510 [Pseudomonas palleroniana]SED49213.1 hypothetical protein SAMN04490198_0326 [Pseudomonas palleroniana]